MIYVPDLTHYRCFVVQSEGVIRAYEQVPSNNTTIFYRDYYIKSNYIYKDNYQSFSNYSTLPICLDSNILTTDYEYRNDFPDILIILTFFLVFCLFLPIKIIMKLFKKGGF